MIIKDHLDNITVSTSNLCDIAAELHNLADYNPSIIDITERLILQTRTIAMAVDATLDLCQQSR